MRGAPKTSSPCKVQVRASLLGFKEKSHILQLHIALDQPGPRRSKVGVSNSHPWMPPWAHPQDAIGNPNQAMSDGPGLGGISK